MKARGMYCARTSDGHYGIARTEAGALTNARKAGARRRPGGTQYVIHFLPGAVKAGVDEIGTIFWEVAKGKLAEPAQKVKEGKL